MPVNSCIRDMERTEMRESWKLCARRSWKREDIVSRFTGAACMKVSTEDGERCNTMTELKGRRLSVRGREFMRRKASDSIWPRHARLPLHKRAGQDPLNGRHLRGGREKPETRNTQPRGSWFRAREEIWSFSFRFWGKEDRPAECERWWLCAADDRGNCNVDRGK